MFTILVFSLLTGCVRQEQKVKNLEAFAKVYGYVKYFHPSDEATKFDWLKFSAYGAKEIENCRTNQQLVNTLTKLFRPIAPSVKFIESNTKPVFNLNAIIPSNLTGYKLTYWQHLGLGTGAKNFANRSAYSSSRVNRDTLSGDNKPFNYQPEFEKIFIAEIVEGVYCQIPMVLYCNASSTFPKADDTQFKDLAEKLKFFDLSNEKVYLKLGNAINVYNVFQHFYPYFDVVDVNWNKEFDKALNRCYTDTTAKDHLITLQKFTAPLKDGHIGFQSGINLYYAPNISWEWIENKLVITHVYRNDYRFHIGDVVTQINGISPEKYFEETKSLISAGTEGWLNYRADIMSLEGEENSLIKITIADKTYDLKRSAMSYVQQRELEDGKEPYKKVEDGIWYLNIVQFNRETFNKLLPDLVRAKAIICDARGYPKAEHYFIPHLMKSDDTTRSWMQIPQIIYPDHQNVLGYAQYNWIQIMKAQKPYIGDKKIIYVIDGSAISYAESCLGYIEGYKLATIVGQPSAGTNGNINIVELLGGFSFRFTGMKVVKHNGSQHHGIGILPNVYVTKTIQGVKESRDEFLEKAIEIAKQK